MVVELITGREALGWVFSRLCEREGSNFDLGDIVSNILVDETDFGTHQRETGKIIYRKGVVVGKECRVKVVSLGERYDVQEINESRFDCDLAVFETYAILNEEGLYDFDSHAWEMGLLPDAKYNGKNFTHSLIRAEIDGELYFSSGERSRAMKELGGEGIELCVGQRPAGKRVKINGIDKQKPKYEYRDIVSTGDLQEPADQTLYFPEIVDYLTGLIPIVLRI